MLLGIVCLLVFIAPFMAENSTSFSYIHQPFIVSTPFLTVFGTISVISFLGSGTFAGQFGIISTGPGVICESVPGMTIPGIGVRGEGRG